MSIPWFDAFGVDEPLVEAALRMATSHGADDAELYFQHSTSTSLSMSDRLLHEAHTSVDVGVGVRVVVGDQVGYAWTEDLSREAVLRAAATASEIARTAARPIPPVGVPSKHPIPQHYPLARSWGDVALAERLPLVRRWEAAAFEAHPNVRKVEVSLSDGESRVFIARADGRRVFDHRPMTTGFVSCSVERDGQRESGSYNLAQRAGLDFWTDARADRLATKAVDHAIRALDAGSPPAGEMPVVLAAGSSGILLHEAIGHGLEADFNRKGTSLFHDRMGQRIAPPGVSIVDDATLPSARGSLNVDDEGNDTERTTLVEDGVLRSYLHDSISARHYGVSPTGSGRRQSFRHPILPRMRATYMEPGSMPASAIVADTKYGIFCETFANGQVQIGGGDFSFYVRYGWLIEDGRLTRPIKDVNLIGNGPKALADIDRVGDDLIVDEGGWTCGKDGQSVPVSQGMPTVRVARLSVGGGR